MKIKYHKRDFTVAHRDNAYFETEEESKQTSTGKKFSAYRLVCMDGSPAPDEVCDLIGSKL